MKRKCDDYSTAMPSWTALLTCPHCNMGYDVQEGRTPRVLRCGHTACESCLNRYVVDNKVQCAQNCRPTNVAEGIHILEINEPLLKLGTVISERIQQQTCTCEECEIDTASVHCVECCASLCQSCCDKTHMSKIFQNHQRVTLSNVLMTIKENCTTHKRHATDFWCQQCHVPICLLCKDYGEHVGHPAELVASSAQKARNQYRMMIKQTSEEVAILKDACNELHDSIQGLETQLDKISSVVSTHFAELKKQMIAALTAREKALIKQCTSIVDEKTQKLQKQRADLSWKTSCAMLSTEIAIRLEMMDDLPFMLSRSLAEPHMKALGQIPASVVPVTNPDVNLHIPSNFVQECLTAISHHGRLLGPTPPVLTQINTNPGDIGLKWEMVNGIRSVQVQIRRSSHPSDWDTVFDGEGTMCVFSAQEKCYYVRGRALDEVEWGDWGDAIKIHADFDASIMLPLTERSYGVLHWIGSARGTKSWNNPADCGLVICRRSSDCSGAASAMCSRGSVISYTQDIPNSWWMVDLFNVTLNPSAYCIWLDKQWLRFALRNWRLEASNDGDNWIVLKEHRNDKKLEEPTHFVTFDLPYSTTFYRMFRVLQFGENAVHGSHLLCLAGVDIFGEARILH